MNMKISDTFYLLLTIIGVLFLLNGLFHAVIYLIDSKSLFTDWRLLNWVTLVFGSLLSLYGYTRLNKIQLANG
ncbi:MAG: hypothetical protein MK226_09075 [Saprospiraceae bacterium]|nr:hypothetical protein [Saprospiraceae bacterium]